MRKLRKVKERKIRKHQKTRKVSPKKKLRAGSTEVKKKLLNDYPYCDICGSNKNLQLHHVYLIRHGFETKLEHCVLLCEVCHKDWHISYDQYWDILFEKDPNTDFMHYYQVTKHL